MSLLPTDLWASCLSQLGRLSPVIVVKVKNKIKRKAYAKLAWVLVINDLFAKTWLDLLHLPQLQNASVDPLFCSSSRRQSSVVRYETQVPSFLYAEIWYRGQTYKVPALLSLNSDSMTITVNSSCYTLGLYLWSQKGLRRCSAAAQWTCLFCPSYKHFPPVLFIEYTHRTQDCFDFGIGSQARSHPRLG